MTKRTIDENFMKEMVSKGFNRRLGTPIHNETPSEDPLDSLPITLDQVPSREETLELKKEKPKTSTETKSEMDMERYSSLFLKPVHFTDKSSFVIHRKTVSHLRAILEDTGKSTSLAGLIENILSHHLQEHKDLINKSTAKNIRKQTLTNL